MLSKDADTDELQPEGMYACTADALICPDGSGVGRSGAECTFSACPQVPSLVGELEQIGGDFQLILPAEGMGGRGYVVPLEVQVSNALGTLVGKQVRAYGQFRVGNTFVVETLEEFQQQGEDAEPDTQSAPQSGEIGYQETTILNGVSVTFSDLIEDNRCPSDVTCITGGRAVVTLELSEEGVQEILTLATDDSETSFNGHVVRLLDVLPAPVSTESHSPDMYTVSLEVE